MSDEHDGYLISLALQELDKEPDGIPARGPIDAVWRAAANGSLSDADAAHWTRIIANRVVASVIDNTSFPDERKGRALKAIGMHDRHDPNYDERRALELFLDFHKLATAPDQQETWPVKLLCAMKRAGFYQGLSDKVAKAKIDRLEQSIRPKSR